MRHRLPIFLAAVVALPLVGAAPEPAPPAPPFAVPALTWADLVPAFVGPEPAGASVRVVAMDVTAYCGGPCCCGDHADGLTASGRPTTHNAGRFVAADWDVLPRGTRLRVPGYADDELVEVLDRGGAITGRRLDVFFPAHADALAWGRRRVEVEVFAPAKTFAPTPRCGGE